MIDEKKLIEILEKIKDNSKIQLIGLTDMINEIKRLPKVGEWIPCSERLPVDDQEVLTCDADGDIEMDTFYDDEFECASFYRDKIIAWMPLPAPYKDMRGGKNE